MYVVQYKYAVGTQRVSAIHFTSSFFGVGDGSLRTGQRLHVRCRRSAVHATFEENASLRILVLYCTRTHKDTCSRTSTVFTVLSVLARVTAGLASSLVPVVCNSQRKPKCLRWNIHEESGRTRTTFYRPQSRLERRPPGHSRGATESTVSGRRD